MSKIKCPSCGKEFEPSEAVAHELEAAKNEMENRIIKETEKRYSSEWESKLKAEREHAEKAATEKSARELTELKAKQKSDDDELRKLRKQMSELLDKLNLSEKAKEAAELEAKKKYSENLKAEREEAAVKATESKDIEILELKDQIKRLNDSIEEAKKTSNLVSQQQQGEVLELDIERRLHDEFIYDEINEIKKGANGADIKQTVKHNMHNCGVILWECKNANNWSKDWQNKLGDDMQREGAQIGIIAWFSNNNEDDCKQLSENVWVVKPRFAMVLASAIRNILIQVDTANKNAENKDAKMSALYSYLTGSEFKAQIKSIVDTYTGLHDELEKEKRSTTARWKRQEKLLAKSMKNIYGMGGDLQELAKVDVLALPNPDSADENEDDD